MKGGIPSEWNYREHDPELPIQECREEERSFADLSFQKIAIAGP
jgi:hypothetical protein